MKIIRAVVVGLLLLLVLIATGMVVTGNKVDPLFIIGVCVVTAILLPFAYLEGLYEIMNTDV